MKSKLPEDEIIQLYNEQRLSTAAIGKIYGVSDVTVGNVLKRRCVKRRTLSEAAREYGFDDTFFERVDTEEKAYWLGFLYADGYVGERQSKICNTVQRTLQINLSEKEPLLKFSKDIKSTYKISEKLYQTEKGYNTQKYSLVMTSDKLFSDLVALGVYQNKSLTLRFPTEEQVPKYLQRHFIRGYFDGDGSIYGSKSKQKRGDAIFEWLRPNMQFCGTLEFLNSLKEITAVGRILKENRKDTNTWYLRCDSIKTIYPLYKLMYENATVWLERKKDKFHYLFGEGGSTTIIGTPTRGLYKNSGGVRDSLILY